jgi:hypothetical protein
MRKAIILRPPPAAYNDIHSTRCRRPRQAPRAPGVILRVPARRQARDRRRRQARGVLAEQDRERGLEIARG